MSLNFSLENDTDFDSEFLFHHFITDGERPFRLSVKRKPTADRPFRSRSLNFERSHSSSFFFSLFVEIPGYQSKIHSRSMTV